MSDQGIDADVVRGWLHRVGQSVAAFRDRLNDLDAAAGDGDIGDNLARGLDAAEAMAAGAATPGAVLLALSDALLNKMGGSSGMLVGMAVRAASRTRLDAQRWTVAEAVEVCGEVCDSIQRRGKAADGDRTLLDALRPAVAAGRSASGDAAAVVARSVLDAAAEGYLRTAGMVPKYGRAAYVGDRALGWPDAGALFVVIGCAALSADLGPATVRAIDTEDRYSQ